MKHFLRGAMIALAAMAVPGVSLAAESITLGIMATPQRGGGCRVTEISSRSVVAARMGMRVGDIILRVNDTRTNHPRDIQRALRTEAVDVIWQRGQKFYKASAAVAYAAPVDQPLIKAVGVTPAEELDSPPERPGDPTDPPPHPPQAAPNGTRMLGVWAEPHRFDNGVEAVRVTRVVPDSPSQNLRLNGDPQRRYYLEPGHYITSVNGRAIGSFDQLRQAIAESEAVCRLKVFNAATGNHRQFIAQLGGAEGR